MLFCFPLGWNEEEVSFFSYSFNAVYLNEFCVWCPGVDEKTFHWMVERILTHTFEPVLTTVFTGTTFSLKLKKISTYFRLASECSSLCNPSSHTASVKLARKTFFHRFLIFNLALVNIAPMKRVQKLIIKSCWNRHLYRINIRTTSQKQIHQYVLTRLRYCTVNLQALIKFSELVVDFVALKRWENAREIRGRDFSCWKHITDIAKQTKLPFKQILIDDDAFVDVLMGFLLTVNKMSHKLLALLSVAKKCHETWL